MESQIPNDVKDKLYNLYSDHLYKIQTISPPWDKYPRNYTYWVANGLSVGGVEFDESVVGGPSINQPSFSPGVILWDAGAQGSGSGYISVSEGTANDLRKKRMIHSYWTGFADYRTSAFDSSTQLVPPHPSSLHLPTLPSPTRKPSHGQEEPSPTRCNYRSPVFPTYNFTLVSSRTGLALCRDLTFR